MLPEAFQRALNSALSMHVCQPKDTIFSTSFKYNVGRPNVNRHIWQTETVWAECFLPSRIWIECSVMKVARYIGNYENLHLGYEPFLNMIWVGYNSISWLTHFMCFCIHTWTFLLTIDYSVFLSFVLDIWIVISLQTLIDNLKGKSFSSLGVEENIVIMNSRSSL